MIWYIETGKSSFIKEVYYDDEKLELTVVFTPKLDPVVHTGVPLHMFTPFGEVSSVGKYYLEFIKPKYTIMADKLKTMNQCSDKDRYIQLVIDVNKVNNKWFFVGEKGTYLHMTLIMKPNGEIDKYGNLGMITQRVPSEIVKKEKDLPKDKKSRGEILGNASELVPKDYEGTPGVESGKLIKEEQMDDLPF